MKTRWYFAKGLIAFETRDERKVGWYIESTVVVKSRDPRMAYRKALKTLGQQVGDGMELLGIVDLMDLFEDEIGDGAEVAYDVFRMHQRTARRKDLFLSEADLASKEFVGGREWRKVLAQRYRRLRSRARERS